MRPSPILADYVRGAAAGNRTRPFYLLPWAARPVVILFLVATISAPGKISPAVQAKRASTPDHHSAAATPSTEATAFASQTPELMTPLSASPTATSTPMPTDTLTPIMIDLPLTTEPSPSPTEATATLATDSPTPVEQERETVQPPPEETRGAEPGPSSTLSLEEESHVTIQIQQANIDFGSVSASGEVDDSANDLVVTVDAGGAYFVRTEAITLTVISDSAWTGTCRVDASIAGRLEWRLTGSETWIPFAESPTHGPYDNACFPVRPVGETTYTYDLRLRVSSSDEPGLFTAAIGFVVAS